MIPSRSIQVDRLFLLTRLACGRLRFSRFTISQPSVNTMSSPPIESRCTLHTTVDPGIHPTPKERVPAVDPQLQPTHPPSAHPPPAAIENQRKKQISPNANFLHGDALEAVEEYHRHVLSYANVTTKWSEILDCARKHPSCCALVHVLVCDYHVALSGFFDDSAKKALLLSSQVIQNRHQSPESGSVQFRCLVLYIEAFKHWSENRLEAAFRCFAGITRLDPLDLFALKRCQLLAFMRGDSRSLLGAALRVLPECRGKPYFHGMLSFALEQNGMLQLALEEGRKGVKILESDAWSHHAVAHCLYFEGDLQGALDWLNRFKHHWESLMPFMRAHSYWHIALCLLDQCKYGQLTKLFDQELWRPDDRLSFEVQLGAAGILWKAELHALMFENPTQFEDHRLEPPLPSWKKTQAETAELRRWARDKMDQLEYLDENSKNFVGYPLYQLLALRVLCAQKGKEDVARRCLESIREFGTRDSDADRRDVYIPLAEAIWHVYGPKKKVDFPPTPPRKGVLGDLLWEREDESGSYHRRPNWNAACRELRGLCHRLTDFFHTIPKKQRRPQSQDLEKTQPQPHRGRTHTSPIESERPNHNHRGVLGEGFDNPVAAESSNDSPPNGDDSLEQVFTSYLSFMEATAASPEGKHMFPSDHPATPPETPPAAHSVPSAGLAPLGGSGEQREVFLEFMWLVVVRDGMVMKLEAAEFSRKVEGFTMNTSGNNHVQPQETMDSHKAESFETCPFQPKDCRAHMVDRISQQQQQMVCFGTLRECIAHSHYAYTPAAISLFATGISELSFQYHKHSLDLRDQYLSQSGSAHDPSDSLLESRRKLDGIDESGLLLSPPSPEAPASKPKSAGSPSKHT